MTVSKADLIKAVAACSALMAENKQYLIDLDSALGDGDLGLTMTAGFAEAASFIAGSAEEDLGKLIAQMGMAMSRKVPSTMGTLVASGFMSAGKALKGKSVLEDADVGTLLDAFTQGVMHRGKAAPGDRTLVDALHPAAEALSAALKAGKPLKEALTEAAAAAREGVEATRQMKPKFGRAVYYGDQVLGKEDQGAVVGSLIVQGFSAALA